MNLEIKHLAPYLPYGLKMTTTMLQNPVELAGLGTDTDIIKKIFIHHHKYTAWYPIENFKPILTPLDNILYIEWLDVFLAGINSLKCPYPAGAIGPSNIIMHDNAVEFFINPVDTITYDFTENQFHSDSRFNQLAAFNELYKLHADLDKLIPPGLAIDENHLKP
jgi:hypothetical protein